MKRLPGHEALDAFLDHASDAAAHQPWVERLPAALNEVVPLVDGERWMVRDRDGEALPLTGREHWTLLALSGGRPVDLAAEWDGEGLLPLGAVASGTYHVLQGDE